MLGKAYMNSQIAEMVRGYARAAAFMERERVARLAALTPEEARAIFDELTAAWDAIAENETGLEKLAEWRLETTLAVRAAFRKMAEAQNLL